MTAMAGAVPGGIRNVVAVGRPTRVAGQQDATLAHFDAPLHETFWPFEGGAGASYFHTNRFAAERPAGPVRGW